MKGLAAHNRLSGTLMPLLFLIVLIAATVISIKTGVSRTVISFLFVVVFVDGLVIYGNHKNLRDIFFDDYKLYLKKYNST